MRLAYLILAHNNFLVLRKLVEMLDDSRNDVYIHFDRKLKDIPEIRTNRSGLYILSDRVDVRWGTVSQIEALFKLYNAAYSNDGYDFYFVISGTHLPLKDQAYIHDYFSKYQGNSVIRRWPVDVRDINNKLHKYHFFISNFQSSNRFRKSVVQKIWRVSMYIQKRLGINRYRNETFIKADEWAVIAPAHINYLLEHECGILKKYRHTFCGDEYYLASELMKFDREHIVCDQNLLFIHFNKESPSDLNLEQYRTLLDSSYIFARKFSDKTIV